MKHESLEINIGFMMVLIVLMIITYWPPLTMWLPQYVYGH